MLSYQHGFHAGNRADVVKHAVLHSVCRHLTQRNDRILYVETHSGRGRYDLEGPQARKGDEAGDGILSILEGQTPKPLRSICSSRRCLERNLLRIKPACRYQHTLLHVPCVRQAMMSVMRASLWGALWPAMGLPLPIVSAGGTCEDDETSDVLSALQSKSISGRLALAAGAETRSQMRGSASCQPMEHYCRELWHWG